jgi:hypothetical protein
MRDTQKIDTFLNYMLMYEGLLLYKPHVEGDDAQRIDFWCTRLMSQLQTKLLQQNLSEKGKTFNEFCTQVRYCEQLEEATGTSTRPESSTSSKRRRDTDGAGQTGKRRDGKTQSNRSSNSNGDSANQGSQNPGGSNNAPFSQPNRNQNGGGWNRG